MKTKYYAAYGSNLNKLQMSYRCPTAKPIAKGLLHDYALVFQGRPFGAHANVIPAKGEATPIVIWKITETDEAALDRYEGVAGGYYTKEYIKLPVAGKMRKVLIYIMTPHDAGYPTDEYLHTIAQGYKDFELDVRYLNDAAIQASQAVRNL